MTIAKAWCEYRQLYLNSPLSRDCEEFRETLATWLRKLRPIIVPEQAKGDSGHVYFEDKSFVTWDWDDSMFVCEGTNYDYPYHLETDPLFIFNEHPNPICR